MDSAIPILNTWALSVFKTIPTDKLFILVNSSNETNTRFYTNVSAVYYKQILSWFVSSGVHGEAGFCNILKSFKHYFTTACDVLFEVGITMVIQTDRKIMELATQGHVPYHHCLCGLEVYPGFGFAFLL